MTRSQYGRQGTSLVLVGERMFAVGGMGTGDIDTNVVEEYNEETDTWTSISFNISEPKRHMAALPVSAQLFNHLPGGCTGI